MAGILLLFVLGVLLICIEVFVPGMILGIAGSICLIIAVILSYKFYGLTMGHISLTVVVVVGIFIAAWWASRKKIVTSLDLSDSKTADSLENLHGKTGTSVTPLRPAGTVAIEGIRIDVVAESGLIEEGASIKVVRVEGNTVFVRRA
jgi:membrane-bound serine protease (ClpP class)